MHPSSNLRGASAKRRAPEEGLIQLSLAKAKQAISHIKNTTDTRLPSRSLADTEIIDLIWLEIMGRRRATSLACRYQRGVVRRKQANRALLLL